VAPARGSPFLVPFTRAAVPVVDVAGGRIVIDPPPGLLEEDSGEED
jgi:16S rRNA processing protein RimM